MIINKKDRTRSLPENFDHSNKKWLNAYLKGKQYFRDGYMDSEAHLGRRIPRYFQTSDGKLMVAYSHWAANQL